MKSNSLDVIDVDFALVAELEGAFAVFLAVVVRLVDLCVLRKFTVGFDCVPKPKRGGVR